MVDSAHNLVSLAGKMTQGHLCRWCCLALGTSVRPPPDRRRRLRGQRERGHPRHRREVQHHRTTSLEAARR